MGSKLFFFDLDGTLLTTDKHITPDTYRALEEWHEAGHRLAISSGRPMPSILRTIEENRLDVFAPYAVAYNGCQIYDWNSGRTIGRRALSLEDVRHVAALAKEAGIHCHTYDDSRILTPADDEEIHYYTRVVEGPVVILPDFPEGITQEPCKMLCIDLKGPASIEALGAELNRLYGDRLEAMRSNPYYLEVFPAGAGKGYAVTWLADHLHIPVSDTCAAGDEQNDISMIVAAGVGVAMSNAGENVRLSADIVTEADNDHDGLAPVLRSLL